MFNKDYNFTPVKALKQHWRQESFSYLEKPRPDYGIMLVLNGRIDFELPQDRVLCAKVGDILFLPKNAYYKARFRTQFGEVDNYLINFESDMDLNCTTPVRIAENVSFACTALFEEFIEAYYNADSIGLRSKGLLYLLLDSVLKQSKSAQSLSDKVLEKAMILLKQDEELSINQIAQACSVSESGLRKMVKDKIGMSPTQFRLKEKFNKAKYLLESTDLSVREISDKLNFYDSAYFCRLFCKNTGLTPRQYRQNKKL